MIHCFDKAPGLLIIHVRTFLFQIALASSVLYLSDDRVRAQNFNHLNEQVLQFFVKIGVIGSGDVGLRLADGLIEHGHCIMVGTRDINKKEVVEWISKHTTEEEE